MKKSIILTFLLLASVFMFAEEHTIVSFNIRYNNEKESFQNVLSYLVEKNNADIVLLQEVLIPKGSDSEEIMKSLTSKLDGSWEWYTTFGYTSEDCPTDQHNAVLVKKEKFKKVNYLNKKYRMNKEKTNLKCKSTYNNVQVLEVYTDREPFFVVNAHVSPHDTYNIECGNPHTEDFLNLKHFIEKIGKKKPLVLGGDMNFGTADLRGNICGERFSFDWFIDGTDEEVPNNAPWVTSVGLNPWDHFIFNKEFKSIIVPKTAKGFKGKYGMRHALNIDEEKGAEIGNGKYMSIEKYGKYYNNVSDHFPICITIDTNKME